MTSVLKTKTQKKSVMIIGGGVAGMAAAQSLNGHNINVHLVEKNGHLGGHASLWACMATDTCQHCSACLSADIVNDIHQTAHLNKHLIIYPGTRVVKIDQTDKKYFVQLKGKTNHTIKADKIILATGFRPAQPQGLLGEKYHDTKRIITTAELNQIFKENTLAQYLPDSSSPEIGFIQCVGSRNQKKGRDYCSQICCKVSLRQINKLSHLYPNAKISLFYIDLQLIGKQIRSEFESLSSNINLIQGVPFEIFNDKLDGKLSVIREDDKTGNRILNHFDMMVLSIGVQASDNNSNLMDMIDISSDQSIGQSLNQWGFITDPNALAQKGIYVAGCAAGPVDILTAQQQGIRCAGQIIQDFNSNKTIVKQTNIAIAIIGDGKEACNAASMVSRQGYDAWMIGLGNKKGIQTRDFHYVPDAELMSIKGATGAFSILYKASGVINKKLFFAIIVAESAETIPVEKKTILSSDQVYSLNDFSNLAQKNLQAVPDSIVFWLDYSCPESKDSSRTALLIAISLAKTRRQITFIIQKMLVHNLNGQRLYDKARKLGIKFLRIDSANEVNIKKQDDKLVFNLKETTLKGIILSFKSDWLVIPEKRIPGNKNPMLAKHLKDHLDSEGYLQSANVRHRLINSPRKGIFYTGSCHDEIDEQDQRFELEQILFSIHKIIDNKAKSFSIGIQINTEQCRNCLTCFRACPHGAIILNDDMKPYIVPEACFSCGLCLSSCPALAIESKGFCDQTYLNLISKDEITIFACERSGALAAKNVKHDDRFNIQTVPCVCRISTNLLLKTLEAGAKKIILASCHQDNCQSFKGTQNAQTLAKQITQIPGIDNDTIVVYPIAANESEKFEAFLARETL
ncbi:MAG: FAD-dependent oxidoreductase [Pseudomonadota bacterium]